MSRYPAGLAGRGSQKWLQLAVNDFQESLNRAIAEQVPDIRFSEITWLSPLREDDYAEYSDRHFLDRLGLELDKVPLSEFWPRRGPVWDGLARSSTAHVFLIEAKAHIPELDSPPSGAGERSARQIRQSLEATKDYLGSRAAVDWTSRFYQHTNRLAHLYWLRTLNDVNAWLLDIYFVGDEEMDGPMTVQEWREAVNLMNSHLGLGRHHLREFCADIFMDVRAFKMGS